MMMAYDPVVFFFFFTKQASRSSDAHSSSPTLLPGLEKWTEASVTSQLTNGNTHIHTPPHAISRKEGSKRVIDYLLLLYANHLNH